ncbi:MAG TPA: hypothetical protein GXZ67_04360 [Clostridiaceae bacterium]|nr:hypothetical protein [Clostridiaceae bacterium]
MTKFEKLGNELREHAKDLILEYMKSNPKCHPKQAGMKQASLFRDSGLDCGDQKNAESTKQQYWVVALLRTLETEGKIERVSPSGPWRLR